MNEAKHTPGPWEFDRSFCVGPTSRTGDQSYGMIESVADVYGENIKADARLIAAAPELLEALIEVMAIIDYGDEPEHGSPGWKARAAIAKATGRANSGQDAQKGTT